MLAENLIWPRIQFCFRLDLSLGLKGDDIIKHDTWAKFFFFFFRCGSETRWPCFLASAGYWPKFCFIRFFFDYFVSFVYSISYFLYTRMSTITTEQLTTILAEKLDEKLAPLNSTVVELRKSLDEAIKHVKFVDANTMIC